MNRSFAGCAITVMLILFGGASCANNHKDHPNRIPEQADVVREGRDKLKWTADMDGVIYVYDSDKKTVRYIGNVRRGEEVVIQPESDRIYVAGRVVFQENLEKHSWHKLYFVGGQGYDQSR